MKKENILEGLNKFIEKHETFQLAFIELVHRYYHEECFTGGENSRFKGDEESVYISNLRQTLSCQVPDWRYRLKKNLERYDGREKTNALHVGCKPQDVTQIPKITVTNTEEK